jgi:hypothetical protein
MSKVSKKCQTPSGAAHADGSFSKPDGVFKTRRVWLRSIGQLAHVVSRRILVGPDLEPGMELTFSGRQVR